MACPRKNDGGQEIANIFEAMRKSRGHLVCDYGLGGRKMNQQRSERDKEFDALWEKGQPIEIKKSQGEKKMSVFSMKIDRELLRVLVETAKQREIGPSTLARELIQEGLLSRGERLSNESLIGIICNRLAENSVHPIDAHNESIRHL